MGTPNLLFIEKISSKLDKTVKFVFRLNNGQIVEFSYIDNGTGKDIICVSTQTGCNLGCKFCFLSDYKFQVVNLSPSDIYFACSYILSDLDLPKNSGNEILLISYMGCGEPLLNIEGVIGSARKIKDVYSAFYKIVRFGVSSLIPKTELMHKFTETVKSQDLAFKFHLSLHSPIQEERKRVLPSAVPVMEAIPLLEFFLHHTGHSVEIHYALIEDVNDKDEDLRELIVLLKGRKIPVKFLAYNSKPNLKFKQSQRVKRFMEALSDNSIFSEYYVPPGRDIGSSCGQFLMDYYERYNSTKKTGR